MSWQQAYRGIIPQLHLDSLIRRRSPEWWRSTIRSGDDVVVIEVAGVVAGYATLGAARRRGSQAGEIYELYLLPDHQGLGFGEILFEACRGILDQRRLKGLVVWVLSENTIASDFYWRRGGRPIARSVERIGPAKLEKIAFAWN
ncbi:MAG: GNAT family N-acetyltransferase [Hyphomicrobium sp.]